MDSLIILDSGNYEKSEDFTVEFKKPIRVHEATKLALKSMSMWVSWHNITTGNNTFKYFENARWHTVVIENGNYTLRELNNFLVKLFGVNDPPIKFAIHFATSRFIIRLDPGYMIDLSQGKLHELLGFEPRTYRNNEQTGKYIANISKGIDDIHIHCDAVGGVHYNDLNTDILYTFTPSHPPGSLIKIDEVNPSFAAVSQSRFISRIRMRITDQNENLIDLNKQRVVYRLVLRNKENEF